MISNLVTVSLSLYTLGTIRMKMISYGLGQCTDENSNILAPVVSRRMIDSSIVLILIRTSKK
jgi:hypothetical protein